MTRAPSEPSSERTIRTNARRLLLGNIAYAIGQWLQFAILARMDGAAAVGRYAFALALTAPVMMFASLQLRFLLASDMQGDFSFHEYRRLRSITTAAGILVVCAIAWAAGSSRAVWQVLFPVCALRGADAMSDLYYGLWQRRERMSTIGWALLLNASSSTVFMAAAALLDLGVSGAAGGSALGSCAALVFVHLRTAMDKDLRRVLPSGGGPVAWRRLGRLAMKATPLGLVLLLGSLRENLPRLFVRYHAGDEVLGLFAAATQLTTAGGIVVGALGSASTPRLATLSGTGETPSFRALARRLALAGVLLGVLGVALSALVGRQVLGLVYRPEFGRGAPMLVVLSVGAAMGFVASLIGYALTAARVIAVQPILLIAALAVLGLGCAALVPPFGGEGAAWAVVAGSAALAVGSWLALSRSSPNHSRTANLVGDGPPVGSGAGQGRSLRLVHVTTVPETLFFLKGQARYMARAGIEVIAISSPGQALEKFRDSELVACFAVPMARQISPLRDLVALARLVALLRELRPDIVDAHTPKGGLLGMMAAWLAGVPVRIYHVHGLRFMTLVGLRRRILRETERLASALATRVLSVSASIARVAVAERLVAKAKVGVLLGGSINGVDASGRFRPPADLDERRAARALLGIPPDAPVIGFVGRLVRDKGLVELARAWETLREEQRELRLLLVGRYWDDDPVPDETIASLRGDPRVLHVGHDWDTPKYYRAMDVVALPTYREGFPVVPLEAAAMGLPVVATTVPGCADAIVDGKTGTLIPPRDEHALAEALRAYVRDVALRERHGTSARERVRREFEQERIWKAMLAEYMGLVAKVRGADLGDRQTV